MTPTETSMLPNFSHILETILYVKSMPTSLHFYCNILGLQYMSTSPRGTSFALGNTVLLLFQLGLTSEDVVDGSNKIARHGPTQDVIDTLMGNDDSQLRQHFCLAVETKDHVKQWEEHLVKTGVKIIGQMEWERGGYSVYFEDPDGHVGEIASRGLWNNY